jgi:hypothetical protein
MDHPNILPYYGAVLSKQHSQQPWQLISPCIFEGTLEDLYLADKNAQKDTPTQDDNGKMVKHRLSTPTRCRLVRIRQFAMICALNHP